MKVVLLVFMVIHNIQDTYNAVVSYRSLSLTAKEQMKQNCLITAEKYYSDKVLYDLSQIFFHL